MKNIIILPKGKDLLNLYLRKNEKINIQCVQL